MRLLKAQNTNLRTINGRGVQFDVNDQVFIESTNSMRVPKGTTAQRPSSPENGHFRYNTDENVFEVYEAGSWRSLRAAEPYRPGITQQTLGTGDAVEKIFGPLASGDTNFPVPQAAQNVNNKLHTCTKSSKNKYDSKHSQCRCNHSCANINQSRICRNRSSTSIGT